MGDQSTAEDLGLGCEATLPNDQRVTAENWRTPPFNRYALQRIQQFTRTARVPRPEHTYDLPDAHQDITGVTYQAPDGVQRTFDDMVNRTWTDGVLVLHKGKVIHEQYLNGMRSDTVHLMFSCSKSMTSTLAGVLGHRGELDVEQSIESLLPEFAETALAGARVQDLLDMRVSVNITDQYTDLDDQAIRAAVAGGWRMPHLGYDGPEDIVAFIRTLTEPDGDHADVFHYRSILTATLGLCIERATGEPLFETFGRLIWQPMGAEHDFVTIVDTSGHAAAGGGFNCCLRDFGRFAWMIASGGNDIVPKGWIEACASPSQELYAAFEKSEYAEVFPGFAYFNKWWVRPGGRVFMALGIHGQTMYIDPDNEFVAAKFSSQPEPVNEEAFWEQILAFEAVAAKLGGK